MNKIGHFEIPTVGLNKARKFYGKIFDWEFREVPEIGYVNIRPPEGPSGGFVKVKKMPKKSQVNLYIEVADIQETLKAVKKAKGKIVEKKHPVGDIGWWASFESPDGCRLYLWQSAPKV